MAYFKIVAVKSITGIIYFQDVLLVKIRLLMIDLLSY